MFKTSKNILNLLNKSQFQFINKKSLSTTQRCLNDNINFNLNEEQIEFRDAARKFVDDVIIPNAAEWDEKNVLFNL